MIVLPPKYLLNPPVPLYHPSASHHLFPLLDGSTLSLVSLLAPWLPPINSPLSGQRDNFEVLIVITFQSSLKPHNGLPIALRVKIQLSIMVHKGRLTLVYFCSLTSCSFHSTLVSLIANSVPSSPYIPFTIARSLYQWFLLIF